MATIHPSIVDLRLLTPGSYRERDVLLALESSLSDDYHCYHSVNWAAVKPNRQHHGEFDIVVLTPAAHLMVLEVKGGLPKLDDLRLQLSNQRDAIRGRLKREALNEVRVEHLLILTDFQGFKENLDEKKDRKIRSFITYSLTRGGFSRRLACMLAASHPDASQIVGSLPSPPKSKKGPRGPSLFVADRAAIVGSC